MQAAGAAHLVQLDLQLDDAVGDQAAVELDLGLAGAAGRAGAAALPLEVGPGADEAGLLVVQPRQLDLQPAFLGPRAAAEDLEDQAGAVDDLAVPGLFQIALLHRRQLVVDDHGLGLGGADQGGQLIHLARTEQGGRRDLADPHDLLAAHIEVEGAGEAHGLFQTLDRLARALAGAGVGAFGMDDDRPDQGNGVVNQMASQVGVQLSLGQEAPTDRECRAAWLSPTAQSSSASGSYSCTGADGMIVEMACL